MRQVVSPLLPSLIEIGLAAPGEIAHVLDHKAVAVERRSDGTVNIGRPVSIIGRRYRRPPCEKERERGGIDRECEPSPGCRKGCHDDKSEDQGCCGQKPAHWFATGASVPDCDRTPNADQ